MNQSDNEVVELLLYGSSKFNWIISKCSIRFIVKSEIFSGSILHKNAVHIPTFVFFFSVSNINPVKQSIVNQCNHKLEHIWGWQIIIILSHYYYHFTISVVSITLLILEIANKFQFTSCLDFLCCLHKNVLFRFFSSILFLLYVLCKFCKSYVKKNNNSSSYFSDYTHFWFQNMS